MLRVPTRIGVTPRRRIVRGCAARPILRDRGARKDPRLRRAGGPGFRSAVVAGHVEERGSTAGTGGAMRLFPTDGGGVLAGPDRKRLSAVAVQRATLMDVEGSCHEPAFR